MISVWSALEALFSPSTTELRFRVSAPIAAFLEPPGPARLALQKRAAKLYDRRSNAAHGQPKHDTAEVIESINLLRNVLIRMIEQGTVPSHDQILQLLLGQIPGQHE